MLREHQGVHSTSLTSEHYDSTPLACHGRMRPFSGITTKSSQSKCTYHRHLLFSLRPVPCYTTNFERLHGNGMDKLVAALMDGGTRGSYLAGLHIKRDAFFVKVSYPTRSL